MDESTETIEVRAASGSVRLGKAVTVAVIIAVALPRRTLPLAARTSIVSVLSSTVT